MAMELIRIDNEGKITARELYEFLELNKAVFARWAKSNIEDNDFYTEGIDWQGFNIVLNGNETKEYKLTIDFAKHLCMLSRSAKGKQARNYFVEAEKRSLTPMLPSTYKEALVSLLASVEENERLALALTEAKPKVDFANHCLTSKDSVLVRDMAKIASKHGIVTGERRLYSKLREWKWVLANSTKPTQYAMDKGYFEVRQGVVDTNYGTRLTMTTMVTAKGQVRIIDRLRKEVI